jgi:hypothetical protein
MFPKFPDAICASLYSQRSRTFADEGVEAIAAKNAGVVRLWRHQGKAGERKRR